MIHYVHIRANHPSRGLLVDHFAPGGPCRAIGLDSAHKGVVLTGPLVPPVGEIHLRPARFFLVTNYPLKCALALELYRQGIREINDTGTHSHSVVSGADGEIAFVWVTGPRSEEHTSELQSLRHLVCRL